MTAKLRQIIDQLNTIVAYKADKSMTDDDFIAGIEAYMLLCSLNDDFNIDCSGLRSRRGRLFAEFIRRINPKSEIQHAISLIRMLHDFIYDRGCNHIPVSWKDTYSELCSAVVESYRKNPLISVTDYLFALDTTSRKDDDCVNSDLKEYKTAINALLEDIESVSPAERVRRVKAYDLSHYLFIADNWEDWAEVKALLKRDDYRQLDDEAFLIWCDVTDQYPIKELKKRSGNSKLMKVEYLRSLAISEINRQRQLKANRKLTKDLRTLNDEIIGDFIDTKIDAGMSLSALRALESIFYLRLQLAQVAREDREPIYNALCCNRFEKLIKAYTKKYSAATSLNEKIEIIYRIQIIYSLLYLGDSEFALEKQEELLGTPELTFAQRYRLENLFETKDNNEEETIERLLAEAATSFDIAILFDIDSLGTPAQYAAVMDLYKSMFNKAIAEGNTTEVANLLSISADCNSNPTRRQEIKKLTALLAALTSDIIPLPVRRVNEIAATVYAQIDKITGKYDEVGGIPA
ncbi:MAG: hypothetical protein NC548_63070 [Lachnospiraceae bacterium]|nr:hypothetical protein [Lachnospiraceae bacterium]